MDTCKTCLFWQMEKGGEYSEADSAVWPLHPVTYERAHTAAEIRQQWGYLVAYCTHPKVFFYERPAHDGAAVYDGSNYAATLVTGEDYGCRLHTASSDVPGKQ